MPEIRNLNNITNLQSLSRDQVSEVELPKVQQANTEIDGVQIPVGRPDESAQATRSKAKPDQLMPDAVVGRDSSQLDAAEQVRTTGYVSATDKLLGLDLQPTTLGVLASPPGNMEAMRFMTPAMRRKIMRNLLDKQRERMRRLTYSLRKRREGEDEGSGADEDESFASMMAEDFRLSSEQAERATNELGKMAKMLDVLDEMLVMQDYTISQMGTFSQG